MRSLYVQGGTNLSMDGLDLFGKMINVSGEIPTKRCMNTDLVKSVVAGDWVTGREVYKKPSKFKPYASLRDIRGLL